jgi:polyisoprenoid-binding protein YceI
MEASMRALSTLALLAVLALNASAADYKLTGENTKIDWTGTKKDGKHTGGFKTVSGTASVKDKAVAFTVEIDCDSLHSDDAKLTAHLKGADFFSVKDHPKAKFVSKKVEMKDKTATITGDLTLLGKTKEISFPAELSTDGGVTLKASFSISRKEFGMTYGEGKIDDKVAIALAVTAK